jgi:Winged helix DNA-binding domain
VSEEDALVHVARRYLAGSTRTPHSFGTFLVDGAVAGTWRHEGGRIVTEPFEQLHREARQELADEAVRLAAFHD